VARVRDLDGDQVLLVALERCDELVGAIVGEAGDDLVGVRGVVCEDGGVELPVGVLVLRARAASGPSASSRS
jgi:uncharacterized protein (UPF0264 family)